MQSTEIEVVSIDNLDEIKLHLRTELSTATDKLAKAIRSIDIPEQKDSIEVKNLKLVVDALKRVEDSISKINFKPVINVSSPEIVIPEIKAPSVNIPDIIVPTPNVNLSPRFDVPEIDLSELNRVLERTVIQILRPVESLISTISSIAPLLEQIPQHQDSLLESLAKDANRNLSNMSAVFSGSSGMDKDEFIDATKRLYRSSSATNTFATVGVASSLVLASNGSRISATFTNDSDSTIYLSKGQTAVVGSGIRLNASGGALINDEFTGDIYAISSGAGKNLCISEVY